jgi:WD40 repeat protein
LTVTPSQVTLTGGSSALVSVQVNPINGFAASVAVQVTGLPAGITISPATFSLQLNTVQKVQITAANSVGSGNVTATFTGTAGATSHGVPVAIALAAPLSRSRTKYVRTDAVTEYFEFVNRHWSLYSPLTNRLFVADPTGNHVMVLDPTTQTRIATLNVPGAFGMDDTPDHTKIYVGTLVGDVYTIDPIAMTVTGRFLGSQIGTLGFQGSIALVLNDGRVALLGGPGGIANVDGFSAFLVWNPVDNSSTLFQTPFTASFGGGPSTIVCGPLENIAGFTRSADRTKLLLGSIDSDNTLCQVDAATGSYNFATMPNFPVSNIAVSPDGKYIATTDFFDSGVLLLDQKTLDLVAKFPVSGDTASDAWYTFSADSSTLYVPNTATVYAYDVNTHQQTGWIPNLVVETVSGGFVTGPSTGPAIVDVGNGLLAGPMEEGVGFLDVAAKHTGAVGTLFTNGYLDVPFGPVGGGSTVNLLDPNPLKSSVNSVFFGAQRSPTTTVNGGLLAITTPPGASGVVDVEVLMNDGGEWILPEGFSYGPSIVQVTPNASTAEGGGTGIIYGYGLGPVTSTPFPTDLTVTVGGQPATVLAFTGNAYGLGAPPYQLEAVAFRIPPGLAGSIVPVTVTTKSGSVTANAAFSYLPPVRTFTAGSTALAQGIYDPGRDVYYFTDATQIQVFSRTQGKFLAPISVPGSQRLQGISLSPDGTTLAVGDALNNTIFLLNPSTPSTIKNFPLPGPGIPGFISNPAGLSISNTGMVYFAVAVQGGTGAISTFFKLDTTTAKVTDYKILGVGGFQANDSLLRTAISADGARVYFNGGGFIFTADTATDTAGFAGGTSCCSLDLMDLTLSSNNTRLSAAFSNYDADLNAESSIALNDREVLNVAYFFGMKLSPDGTLLFQPSTLGIDVLDGHLGTLRTRLSMPFSFAPTFDALVADGKDNVLIGITGAGANQIAVIDLSSLPEPAPLPFARFSARQVAKFGLGSTAKISSQGAVNTPRPPSDRTLNLPARPPFATRVPRVVPLSQSVESHAFWDHP